VPHFWLKIALVLMLILLLQWFLRLPTVEYLADKPENH